MSEAHANTSRSITAETVEMSTDEKYLFDLLGFVVVRDVLSKEHLEVANAAIDAMETAFGTSPSLVREGGSIGAVVTMEQYLRAPIVFLGLSLPEHGYHAPNENFDWQQASGGIRMFVRYFENVAKIG